MQPDARTPAERMAPYSMRSGYLVPWQAARLAAWRIASPAETRVQYLARRFDEMISKMKYDQPPIAATLAGRVQWTTEP